MSGRSVALPTFPGQAGAAALAALLLTGAAALADPLPAPVGPPVLTVDGAITVSNQEGQAVFDMAMLQHLPKTSFRTSTVWTEGVREFEGVALATLLQAVGAGSAGTVSARAINDYAIEIPVSEIGPDAPIIAYRIDGAEFSRREKGPLWVVYPYDRDESYRSEVTYGRSIWQLDRLTVLE